jgi:hypothetical protein
MKTVSIAACIIAVFMVWQLIPSHSIGTPTLSISDLQYGAKENCGKAADVRGKVVRLINNYGYEIEQDGVSLRVAVGKQGGKSRPLPAIGQNIEAHLLFVCSSRSALVMGTSFSELP